MANTVIDSLIVTLGLDSKQFTAGQKKAAQGMLQTESTVRDSAAGMGESLDRLATKFTGFFLGFAGLAGVIDLLKQTTSQFNQLYLASSVLGSSVKSLRAWGEETKVFGG